MPPRTLQKSDARTSAAHRKYLASDRYAALRAEIHGYTPHDPTVMEDAQRMVHDQLASYLAAFRRDGGVEYVLLVANRYRLGLHPYLRPNARLSGALYGQITDRRLLSAYARNTALHDAASQIEDIDVHPYAHEMSPSHGDDMLARLRAGATVTDTNVQRGLAEEMLVQMTWRGIGAQDDAGRRLRAIVDDPQNVHDRFVREATDDTISTVLREYGSSGDGKILRSEWMSPDGSATAERVEGLWDRLLRILGRASRLTQGHDSTSATYAASCHLIPDLRPYLPDIERAARTFTVTPYAGCSEEQLLRAVLWKIHTVAPDPETRVNWLTTLGMQVASSVEAGKVVCSTGKKSRIASVLQMMTEGGQKNVDLKAIRQEVMRLAAKTREEFLDSPKDDPDRRDARRAAYETGCAETAADLLATFLRGFHEQYDALLPRDVRDMIVEEAGCYF